MKILSDKKFNDLLAQKELEHCKEINKVCDKFESQIDRLCDENKSLRRINNNFKSQLKDFENNKIRYLKMIENKSFKSKRLRKKYQDKLIREIKLLFGGEDE